MVVAMVGVLGDKVLLQRIGIALSETKILVLGVCMLGVKEQPSLSFLFSSLAKETSFLPIRERTNFQRSKIALSHQSFSFI